MLFLVFSTILTVLWITPDSECFKNNVCPTLLDYHTKEINPRCWYDPDVYLDAIQILDRYKYNYEVHTAVTADGYILNVYRLPPKRQTPKGLVFFSHSALANMIMWIDKGRESIAFLLVDEGYDVYLGNFRGTPYSREHVTLSRKDQPNEYWNHSFHEMGIYDLPVQLELVRNVSGSPNKIYFIGHSLGGTVAYIYASLLPKHAEEYIRLSILWAPAVFVNVDKSIYRFFTPFADAILKLITLTHLTDVFAYNDLHLWLNFQCFEFPRVPELCNSILNLVFGIDSEDASAPLSPSITTHNAIGFSAKGVAHYAQLYNSRRFQWFDYGNLNKYYYNSHTPPEYPIEKVSIPMYFFIGLSDAVAPQAENRKLYNTLRPNLQYGIKEVNYNHFNFLYGKNLLKNLHIPTINVINSIEANIYNV